MHKQSSRAAQDLFSSPFITALRFLGIVTQLSAKPLCLVDLVNIPICEHGPATTGQNLQVSILQLKHTKNTQQRKTTQE